ncbi:MAG: ABC transporter permease [Trueperaceae bacterium]
MIRGAWVWTVARKEILSTVRDRRALISNLLIPLLVLPVVMLGLPLLMGGLFEREQASITAVALEAREALPEPLREAIQTQNAELEAVDDALLAVRDDRAPVGLIVPDGYAEDLAAGATPTLRILTKAGNLQSELATGKVRSAIEAYRQGLVAERLADAGLEPAVLTPVVTEMRDASRPEEQSSGQLAWIIPFFVAIWALAGGQMTAIDATAGEKERGTLEALLVAPVRRAEVVAGKFLATLATAVSASTMAIFGIVLGGVLMQSIFLPRLDESASEMVNVMGGTPNLSFGGFWLLLISAVLLAAAISALLIAIATFARSFKEAQSYIAPLSFVLIVPAIGLQFADLLDFGSGIYLVPVVNVMLLIDDVLGGSVAFGDVLATWGSMALLVVALLAFALQSFKRESVIFRT